MYKAWTPFLKCIFCDKELLLLSHFSRVRLCVTPQTAAHQAPPSLGFSRQEHPNNISIWYSLSGKDYEDMGLGRLEFSCIKFNTYLTASHIHYFHSLQHIKKRLSSKELISTVDNILKCKLHIY